MVEVGIVEEVAVVGVDCCTDVDDNCGLVVGAVVESAVVVAFPVDDMGDVVTADAGSIGGVDTAIVIGVDVIEVADVNVVTDDVARDFVGYTKK